MTVPERKRADLERGRRRFDAVFESPDAFVSVLAPDGRLLGTNRTALEFVDAVPADVEGKAFWDTPWWTHSEDLRERLRAWIERAEAGEYVRFESTHCSPECEEIPFEGVIRPVTDQNGDVESLVVEEWDVTARKERERELRRQNERLEEFASVTSHGLRNPLRVASANLDLAGEECDSEYLENASDALDRMDDLVDALLSLARKGRVIDEPEPVDFAGVVESAWETAAGNKPARIHLEADCPPISGDEQRVYELLENLFRNAIEHADDSVTVRVGGLDDGFYVEDSGPGIPPEERADVFESGYTTRTDGTGLGLAIVREIAHAHNWDVSVTTGSDGGARFEFLFDCSRRGAGPAGRTTEKPDTG